jgi:hypothetical protein
MLTFLADNTFAINFWSSIIAGATSTMATNPIWVIKTRLMSQTPHHDRAGYSLYPKGANTPTSRPTLHAPWHYKSTLDAARKMYTTEGILSFYSGLTPALLGLTHVAVQFPAYEFFKMKFTGRPMGAMSGKKGDQGVQWHILGDGSVQDHGQQRHVPTRSDKNAAADPASALTGAAVRAGGPECRRGWFFRTSEIQGDRPHVSDDSAGGRVASVLCRHGNQHDACGTGGHGHDVYV